MPWFKHRHWWVSTSANSVGKEEKTVGGLILQECSCGAVRTIEFRGIITLTKHTPDVVCEASPAQQGAGAPELTREMLDAGRAELRGYDEFTPYDEIVRAVFLAMLEAAPQSFFQGLRCSRSAS